MIIIGELINASRKGIGEAIEARDSVAIGRVAREQCEAGVAYIDVQAGIFVEGETEYLKWLIETVQRTVDAPCCLDSPNPRAIEAALSVHKGIPMINSISLEKDRYENLLPIVAGTDLRVVALCMSDGGIPKKQPYRLLRTVLGLTVASSSVLS